MLTVWLKLEKQSQTHLDAEAAELDPEAAELVGCQHQGSSQHQECSRCGCHGTVPRVRGGSHDGAGNVVLGRCDCSVNSKVGVGQTIYTQTSVGLLIILHFIWSIQHQSSLS